MLVEQNTKLVFEIADDIVILNTGRRGLPGHARRAQGRRSRDRAAPRRLLSGMFKSSRSTSLFGHDLFRKPVATFRDHALKPTSHQGTSHGERLEQVRCHPARAQTRPGRETRPTSLTLDIHSHVGVPRAARARRAASRPLDRCRWCISQSPRRKAAQRQAGGRHRDDGSTNLDERLADLDAMGVDMQLIMPPPPQCYYTVPLDIAVQGGAHRQRRHRRVCRTQARPPRRARQRADAGRQRGREGARALHGQARLQGRADPDQRRRQGAVRPGLRAVLGEGRGARRPRRHPPQRLHPCRAAARASTSTT